MIVLRVMVVTGKAAGAVMVGAEVVAGMAALVVEMEAGVSGAGLAGMGDDSEEPGAGAWLEGAVDGETGAGVAGAEGGQRVIVLGTAVIMAGFAETCSAQMPAR